jgi:hypothetical protein
MTGAGGAPWTGTGRSGSLCPFKLRVACRPRLGERQGESLRPSPRKPGPMPRLGDDDSPWQEPWWNADSRALASSNQGGWRGRAERRGRMRISVCRRSASFFFRSPDERSDIRELCASSRLPLRPCGLRAWRRASREERRAATALYPSCHLFRASRDRIFAELGRAGAAGTLRHCFVAAPVIGPAISGRTRWLLATTARFTSPRVRREVK